MDPPENYNGPSINMSWSIDTTPKMYVDEYLSKLEQLRKPGNKDFTNYFLNNTSGVRTNITNLFFIGKS